MTRRSSAAAKDTPPPAPAFPAIPPADVLGRLAALRTLPTAELKRQWRELFGKEPPPFNRPYLVSRLSHRVQELAHGGLKPETRARLEALGEQLDGGATWCCAASAPTAARSQAPGWSGSTGAWSTR